MADNRKNILSSSLGVFKQILDPIIGEDGTLRKILAFATTLFVLVYNYLKYHYDLGYYALFLGVPKALIEKPDLQAFSLNIIPAVIVLILILFSYYVAFHFIEFVKQTWPNKWKIYKWFCIIVLALGMLGLNFLKNKFIGYFDWDFSYCFIFFFVSCLSVFFLFDYEMNPKQDDSAEDKKIKWQFRWMFIVLTAFIIIFWFFMPQIMQNLGKKAVDRELTFNTIKHDTLFTETISNTPPGFTGECDYVVLYVTSDHYIIAPYSISRGNASNETRREMTVYNEYIVAISKDDRFLKKETVDKVTINTPTSPTEPEDTAKPTEQTTPEETTQPTETTPPTS